MFHSSFWVFSMVAGLILSGGLSEASAARLDALGDSGRRPELLLLGLGLVASGAVRLDTARLLLLLLDPLRLGGVIAIPLTLCGSGSRRSPGAESHEGLCGCEVALGRSDGGAAEVVAERSGGGGHGGFLTLRTRARGVSNFWRAPFNF